MRQRSIRMAIIWTTTALLLGGCSMQYNGAMGGFRSLKQREQDAISAYREQLASRDLALRPQLRRPRRPRPAAALTSPQRQTLPAGNLATAGQPLPPASAVPAAPRPAAAPTVFGGLPTVSAAPVSRPQQSNTAVHRVTFANEGADFDPEIDRTSEWLVFASTRHRETADLYFKRIGSSAVTQLTSDPGNDVMPAIAPDGKQIAFASDRGGNWDVYLMDSTGGQAMQLTNDPAHEIHPSFSSDGKWLVYCRYGDQSGQWELVVIELASPSTKRFIGYGLVAAGQPDRLPAGPRAGYALIQHLDRRAGGRPGDEADGDRRQFKRGRDHPRLEPRRPAHGLLHRRG